MSGLTVITAFVCGFVTAQLIKLVAAVAAGKKKPLKYLTKSGGMPSGHAASCVAAAVCLGLGEGFDSTVFALAVCFTIVVLYDALNVRYVVGEHGKILTRLIKKPIKIAEGHTFLEVIVGILLGISIGIIIYKIF